MLRAPRNRSRRRNRRFTAPASWPTPSTIRAATARLMSHDSFDDARAAASRRRRSRKQAAASVYRHRTRRRSARGSSSCRPATSSARSRRCPASRTATYTTSHGVAASDWLAPQWKQLAGSRADITVEQFAHRLSAEIRDPDDSRQRSGRAPSLGGHLDSTVGRTTENTRSPGADDDASGIASSPACACCWRTTTSRSARSSSSGTQPRKPGCSARKRSRSSSARRMRTWSACCSST